MPATLPAAESSSDSASACAHEAQRARAERHADRRLPPSRRGARQEHAPDGPATSSRTGLTPEPLWADQPAGGGLQAERLKEVAADVMSLNALDALTVVDRVERIGRDGNQV